MTWRGRAYFAITVLGVCAVLYTVESVQCARLEAVEAQADKIEALLHHMAFATSVKMGQIEGNVVNNQAAIYGLTESLHHLLERLRWRFMSTEDDKTIENTGYDLRAGWE